MTDAEVGPMGAYRAARVPVAARFFTSLPESKHRLRNPPACRYADNKKDQANHQEQEEQEFGNPCGGSGNTRKSKKRRHQRDYKKNQGPTQHAFTSKKTIAFANRCACFLFYDDSDGRRSNFAA